MDITDRILKYREAIMHIWNDMYVPVIKDKGGDFNIEENFCDVEIRLFETLVLYYLPNDFCTKDIICSHMKRPGFELENFVIVPSEKIMRANVNRELHSGYWDHPKTVFSKDEAIINLVHFFDWATYDCPRDYEFYLGRIKECKSDSQLSGKDVIIPVVEAKVLYEAAEPASALDRQS